MTVEAIHEALGKVFPHVSVDPGFEEKGVTVWRCTDVPLSGEKKYSKLASFALVSGHHVTKLALSRMIDEGKSIYENHMSAGDISVVGAGFFNGYGKIGRAI